MKGRWKHPISGMGWYKQAKRDFAALPEKCKWPRTDEGRAAVVSPFEDSAEEGNSRGRQSRLQGGRSHHWQVG